MTLAQGRPLRLAPLAQGLCAHVDRSLSRTLGSQVKRAARGGDGLSAAEAALLTLLQRRMPKAA